MPGTITSRRQIVVYAAVAAVLLAARPQWPTFVLGCALAAAGIAIRIWGCGHLRKMEEMIDSGPFAHVQHPLYLGTFLIACGAILAAGSTEMPGLLMWVVVAPVFLLAFFGYYLPKKKRVEGGRLEKKFGERFARWHRSVPAFFPSLKPYPEAAPRRWDWQVFRGNHELEMDILVMALFGAMLLLRGGGGGG